MQFNIIYIMRSYGREDGMKKPEQWSRFDMADGLATEADMVAYLQAALEDGDGAADCGV